MLITLLKVFVVLPLVCSLQPLQQQFAVSLTFSIFYYFDAANRNFDIISAKAAPFRISFYSDSYELVDGMESAAANSVGFKIKYIQVACT